MWDENTIRRTGVDYPLLMTVILLTGIGLAMVFSASAVLALEKFGDQLFFLKKSLIYTGVGFFAMIVLMKIPYFHLRKFVYPLLLVSLCLGVLTVATGLGQTIGGARRWLQIGPLTFQASELMKIAIVLFMAYSLEKKREKMETFTIGIIPHLAVAGVLILFVLSGRDLGSAFVMGMIVFCMLFLGGARVKHLFLLSLASLPFLYYLVAKEGYRMQRLFSFLNPWEDRLGSGFQIIQSYLAFNEGGLFGKGLGAGQQKLFYLPEAHTDFIFSVLGEELGLIGVMFVTGLFLFLCWRGIRITRSAPCLFGKFLGLGIVGLIAVQSLLNMGVVMGLLPTKGLVLPFIGYGGSSLVTTLMAMGILLNVSTYQRVDTPGMFGNGQRTTDNGQRTKNKRVAKNPMSTVRCPLSIVL